MSGTTISRRVSEFSGVALFALALVWLIALTTYDPADAVWFFNSPAARMPPHNFVGQAGALLAELSYQVVGFAAFLLPGDRDRGRVGTTSGAGATVGGRHQGVRPQP